MDFGLKDRVAIVAASSDGLGKAVALGLGREGAKLALCSRNQAKLDSAVDEIRGAAGVEIFARTVDVTDYDQVKAFTRQVHEHFGRIDICVTNAGGPPAKRFSEITLDDWRTAIDLNLLSTVYFAKEVLPILQTRRWGRLISITSVSAKQPIDGLLLSNSVRAGAAGLMKTLANEYGADNILVNNVCPGYTATERLNGLASKLAAAEGVTPEKIRDRWAASAPLRRIAEPEEFANVVVFLASERASYITGSSIAVDGGSVKAIF